MLFAPNPDTPERLVIAVAAVGGDPLHVAAANAGRRLSCLYGSAAATSLMVQQARITSLREDLAVRGRAALEDPQRTFSGISIGPVRAGEAKSIAALATSWLRSISSLHEHKQAHADDADDSVENAMETMAAQADNDKLPVLVFPAVEQIESSWAAISAQIFGSERKKAPRPKPQTVFIGFAGNSVVANFATLKTSRPRPLIDHIKRLMWDLARHRDDEAAGIGQRERSHEMIVYRRGPDDPEYDDRKGADLDEMVEDLQE